MKTLICLAMCALVVSTYAAPLSNQAEMESFFSSLINGIKKVAPHAINVYKALNDGVEKQDMDDDDRAQIEALLEAMQDDASIEGFFSGLKNAFNKVRDFAGKTAPYVKKGIDLYNAANGGAKEQQDYESDLAQLQAIIESQDEVALQGWLADFYNRAKGLIKKAVPYVKKGIKVYDALNTPTMQENGDDDLAQLEALLSSVQEADDGDDDTQMRALLQSFQNEANKQSWWNVAKHVGKFGLNMLGKKK